MSTNEKTANKIIEELEQENERLRYLLQCWWKNAWMIHDDMPDSVIEETRQVVEEAMQEVEK